MHFGNADETFHLNQNAPLPFFRANQPFRREIRKHISPTIRHPERVVRDYPTISNERISNNFMIHIFFWHSLTPSLKFIITAIFNSIEQGTRLLKS